MYSLCYEVFYGDRWVRKGRLWPLQNDPWRRTVLLLDGLLLWAAILPVWIAWTLSWNRDNSIGQQVLSLYNYAEYSYCLTDALKAIYNQSVLYKTTAILLQDLLHSLFVTSRDVFSDYHFYKMQLCYIQFYDILNLMPESLPILKQMLTIECRMLLPFLSWLV